MYHEWWHSQRVVNASSINQSYFWYFKLLEWTRFGEAARRIWELGLDFMRRAGPARLLWSTENRAGPVAV